MALRKQIIRRDWDAKAANILKAELKQQGVTYAQLAELIGDKEPNVQNKLSRGKFSAAYMLQCLAVINVVELRIKTFRGKPESRDFLWALIVIHPVWEDGSCQHLCHQRFAHGFGNTLKKVSAGARRRYA